MSEPSLPTDELKALIAEERQALGDPGAARARLAERLASELAGAAVVEPPAPTAAPTVAPPVRGVSGLVTALATFGTGMAVGAVLHSVAAPAPRVEVRYVDRVVEVERAPDEPEMSQEDAAVAAPVPIAPALPTAKKPLHQGEPRAAEPARESDGELARERLLIDKARSALARRDAAGALTALDEHARAFARGQLVEAREALAVQALASAGRAADARKRAERFHQKFPGSPYAPVVDAALSAIP